LPAPQKERPCSALKKSALHPARAGDRAQLSVALTTPRPRTHHRGSRCAVNRPPTFLLEDIGCSLKGGVKVCQRQLVNEMLGPFVAEFDRFGPRWRDTYPVRLPQRPSPFHLGCQIHRTYRDPSRRQVLSSVEQPEMSKRAVILLLVHHPLSDLNQTTVGSFDFLQYLLCVWILFALCALMCKICSFDVLTNTRRHHHLLQHPTLLICLYAAQSSSISRLDEPAWSALTQRREIDSSFSDNFPAR
jgi:hypothetical protein